MTASSGDSRLTKVMQAKVESVIEGHGSTADGGPIENLIRAQSQAWHDGRRLMIEDLVNQADHASPDVELTNDDWMCLVCNEVVLREQAGERPTLDEYRSRFPRLTEELRLQWEIDHLLDTDDLCQTRLHGAAGNAIVTPMPAFIGRFEVVGELGRGGMGIVYKVYDPNLKRTLALKRLKAGLDADAADVQRFRTEAKAIAQLKHSNIVPIYDIAEEGSSPYFVMEYCAGGTLAQRLAAQPLEPRLAAQLLRQVANGVAAAHALRIIHRDLKSHSRASTLVDRTWTRLVPTQSAGSIPGWGDVHDHWWFADRLGGYVDSDLGRDRRKVVRARAT